jgi:cytoskeleton protein RodZ
MRVIVDGQRVVEREVPAGTRLPLNAEKTIVIRTGDAGAVRLTIRGQEPAFLGVEGEVVTRSFTVPPRAAPAGR